MQLINSALAQLMKKFNFISCIVLLYLMFFATDSFAYWQQRIAYKMDIDVDVASNTFEGSQQIKYYNNSPDTITHLYFHLYWNAFRPGSLMDINSLNHGADTSNGKPDWDSRVKDRISKLKEDEMGMMDMNFIKYNGRVLNQELKMDGTILEVTLDTPLLPNQSIELETSFKAQVPVQIRRAGRANPTTGVQFSMSQWYPKMCEYDTEGWDLTPYVAREFYGVWGCFDVHISIDKNYKLGATGVLQNANEIGWGYDKPGSILKKINSPNRTWNFSACDVHDFVWAADTAYKHLVRKSATGVTLHTIYKDKFKDTAYDAAWVRYADVMAHMLPYIEQRFGKYLYPQYSFIQGGDGGMEYAMATLVTTSSIGLAFHEWMHNWYQQVLGTNESKYPWMDEGFTEYAAAILNNYYLKTFRKSQLINNAKELKKLDSILTRKPLMHSESYDSYFEMVASEKEEPLTTQADHFESNRTYGNSVYSKGSIFLNQLGYIVGTSTLDTILLRYYDVWKLKHPRPEDFMRIAERVSNMELDWYYEYWINTTKHIDYAIDSVFEDNGSTKVFLSRVGQMPMPIDIAIEDIEGRKIYLHIPLDMTLNPRSAMLSDDNDSFKLLATWQYTNKQYVFELPISFDQLSSIEIDETHRMADIDRANNLFRIMIQK